MPLQNNAEELLKRRNPEISHVNSHVTLPNVLLANSTPVQFPSVDTSVDIDNNIELQDFLVDKNGVALPSVF